ncbi:winged helix-turn-helix domain-containing protein [Acinetobacter sp.]|uniref:winged helix-turn-helix domain-containing protein n=1 Tax=Acinetobacter sp. TaxID=472 RepID=UPI0035B4EC73
MTQSAHFSLKLRIYNDDEIAFGPGKAELLQAIHATGSISKAAKQMNMSYRRAWQLVDTMNRNFISPLVTTQTGGSHGGGAQVTAFGLEVVEKYQQMQTIAKQSVESEMVDFSKLIQNVSKKFTQNN